jgi:hypothetical protein
MMSATIGRISSAIRAGCWPWRLHRPLSSVMVWQYPGERDGLHLGGGRAGTARRVGKDGGDGVGVQEK